MNKRWFLTLVLVPALLSGCVTKMLDVANLEEHTLDSLIKVDDHPLYVMNYYGPYVTEDASRDKLPDVQNDLPAWACSLFAALGDEDALLYGRNFDWEHSPAVLLFTSPPDGYASVSLVDVAYLDFTASELRQLDKLSLEKRRPLLYAPFLPFDGMNEHGLVVGMAAVPDSLMPRDPDKQTVGSLGVIREILDHAKTVDEAVNVMAEYNIDMAGGPTIHYLIADATGKAVLVEFYQGERVIMPNESTWHLATNFLRAAVDDPAGQCWRYGKLDQRLSEAQGRLTPHTAMELLDAVSQGSTQWSVIYGITSGKIDVVMGQKYDQVYTFHISGTGE